MSVFPGDDVGGFEVQRLVAYQRNADCKSWRCTRRNARLLEDGSWDPGECWGWHCSLCDEPCSMMGHDCPRSGDVAA